MRREDFTSVLLERNAAYGVEVGVAAGAFSVLLLQRTNLVKLWSVDNWMQRRRPKRCKQPWGTAANMKLAIERLKVFGSRSIVLRQASIEASKTFIDGSLDFVYIDATHNYESVTADLNAWWPKLKENGVMAGHDYDKADMRGCGGVIQAVDDFAKSHNLNVCVTDEDRKNGMNESWWLE